MYGFKHYTKNNCLPCTSVEIDFLVSVFFCELVILEVLISIFYTIGLS